MDETSLPPQKSPEELAAMLVALLDVEARASRAGAAGCSAGR
jgi:hypothetical protein